MWFDTVSLIIALVMFIRYFYGVHHPEAFPDIKFDERQMRARGFAFEIGFIVMTVYFIVLIIIIDTGITWFRTTDSIVLGLILGITALSHIEIKKEAFLSITYSNNPLISFIGFGFLGLLYIASAIYFLLTRPHEYLFQDGFLPSEIVGLISGVCISSIAVANLISIYRQKKAKKEDDE